MNTEPSITDWIQSIGVLLGVPITIWGVIKLFRKDKSKEIQIQQFKSQLDELISLNASLVSANELAERQIEVEIKKLKESQKQKELERRRNILPRYVIEKTILHSDRITIEIKNNGHFSYNQEIENCTQPLVARFDLRRTRPIEPNENSVIIIYFSEDFTGDLRNKDFTFDLIFMDLDGSKYLQRIKYSNLNTTISSIPELQ